MKVAFDEHVPPALVRVLQALANERQFRNLTGGLEVEKARDYAPSPSDCDYLKGNDVPWIRRFSRAGGKVIISGDAEMMRQPHERLALIEEKMIVIFFQSKWSQWRFYRKCAFIFCWWPRIIEVVKNADDATFWRVPSSFAEDAKIAPLPTEDQKLVKILRQRAAQPNVSAQRKLVRQSSANHQNDFGFPELDAKKRNVS